MPDIAFLLVLALVFVTVTAIGLTLMGSAKWILSHPERWLIFAVLIFGLLPLGGDGAADGSLLKQLFWSGLFLYSAVYAGYGEEGRFALRIRFFPLTLVILITFTAISVLWSPFPVLSIKRVIQIFGVVFVALAVAGPGAGGRCLLDQLQVPTTILILVGLMVALIAPRYAFDHDHALKALTTHKNTWGQFSLLASIVFLAGIFRRSKHLWCLGVMLVISVLSLFASRSTTSILSFGIIICSVCFLGLFFRGGLHGKFAILLTLMFLMVGGHIYTVSTGEFPVNKLVDKVYAASGKNATLTGRTYLWQLMAIERERHPWFGISYGGFWTKQRGASDSVLLRVNWGPPTQAHNGYIDIINEIGFVGFALVVFMLLHHAIKIIKLYKYGFEMNGLFHGALLLSALIINCAESSIIRTTHLWWVILCISIVEVHLNLLSREESLGGVHQHSLITVNV